MVISSYSDLDKISSSLEYIHFRKFLSKRALSRILSKCEKIKIVSISKYAYNRCDKNILGLIEERGIKIIVRQSIGRPNMLERL